MTTNIRRILLLTGTAPDTDGVGAIILDDLCKFLPDNELVVVYLVDHAGAETDVAVSNGAPMRRIAAPYKCRPESRWGKAGRALSWFNMTLRNRRAISQAMDECVDYARAQAVTEIWAVLDKPASIELAARVARKLALQLKAMIWDDIEHNIQYFSVDPLTARRLRNSFADAVRLSSRCAVIGETMQAEYSRRYGQNGVIVRHGIAQVSPRAALNQSPSIRIGFAGSVTARSAFDLLMETLDGLNWELCGRPITLVLLGGRFDLRSRVARRIECLGWCSVDQTIDVLSGCHLNYLPQPFENEWRPFAELSFPSKLTAYLAAGAPILLHAPVNASLPRFFAQYHIGALCTQLDLASLEQTLRRLAFDSGVRSAAAVAIAQALGDEFTSDRFQQSFSTFLGISKEREAMSRLSP